MTKILSSKFFIPILQSVIGAIFLAVSIYAFNQGSELIAQPKQMREVKRHIIHSDSICKVRYSEVEYMKQKDSILLEKLNQVQLLLLNEQQQNKKLFKAIINNTAELKSLKDFIE